MFKSALSFVLEHQFVATSVFPGELWKVVQGSGMGLRSSAHIANTAFLHHVEFQGLSLATKRARDKYGIKQYTRYADNLLFVCRFNYPVVQALIHDLKFNMRPFTGSVEELGVYGVDFLDLTIRKDDAWRSSLRVSITPFLKPTSLTQALNSSSAHSASIHSAWMTSYIMRLRRHSTSLAWFRTSKAEVLKRLRAAGINHSVVQEVDNFTAYTWPQGLPRDIFRLKSPSQVKHVWIVLPFHPVWSRDINSCLARMSKSQSLSLIIKSFLGNDVGEFRAAWKYSMPSLSTVVRRF